MLTRSIIMFCLSGPNLEGQHFVYENTALNQLHGCYSF